LLITVKFNHLFLNKKSKLLQRYIYCLAASCSDRWSVYWWETTLVQHLLNIWIQDHFWDLYYT